MVLFAPDPDTMASLCTAVMSVIHCLWVNQRPIPASSILEFMVAYSVCPLALYLLGPQRYARCRAPLVGLARFLTMRGSLGVGIGLGPLPQRFWTGFVWRLVLATLGITQLWITLAFQLPTGAHLVASLLSAADYFRHGLPAHCPLTPSSKRQPWLPFTQAPESFRQVAVALDWPFWRMLGVDMNMDQRFKVSDASVCCAVTAWTHLAVCVVVSTGMAYVLDCQSKARAARRSGAVLQEAGTATSLSLAVASALYVCASLWCVLRVATIKLL